MALEQPLICAAPIQELFLKRSVFMDHSLVIFQENRYNSRCKDLNYIFLSVSSASCNVNIYII